MSKEDVTATAGLRRLVTHARDQVVGVTAQPPASWQYTSDRWTAGEVRRYAALLLVRHTLTLVLDCLPTADHVSADEVREMTEKHAAELAAAERRGEQIREQLNDMTRQRQSLREEVEAAVEAQAEAESIEAETFERWEQAVALAQTNAKKAIDFLLSDAAPDPAPSSPNPGI